MGQCTIASYACRERIIHRARPQSTPTVDRTIICAKLRRFPLRFLLGRPPALDVVIFTTIFLRDTDAMLAAEDEDVVGGGMVGC
jgi:hypothetical protein